MWSGGREYSVPLPSRESRQMMLGGNEKKLKEEREECGRCIEEKSDDSLSWAESWMW